MSKINTGYINKVLFFARSIYICYPQMTFEYGLDYLAKI